MEDEKGILRPGKGLFQRGRAGGRWREGGRSSSRGSGNFRNECKEVGADRQREKRTRPTRVLQTGKVVSLNEGQGFGFVNPTDKAPGKENLNVYFRIGDDSNMETGLLELEIGDVLEYATNGNDQKPRAMYGCLLQCQRRSPLVLGRYLDKLLSMSAEKPGNVLRQITKCPVGCLLVLGFYKPPLSVVCTVLKLADVLSNHKEAAFYGARLKQFYRFFPGTEFLRSPYAFREYVLGNCNDENEGMLVKKFMLRLVEQIPDVVSDFLPLLNGMADAMSVENRIPLWFCEFLMQLLRTSRDGIIAVNNVSPQEVFTWDKMPLVPLDSEIGSGGGQSRVTTNALNPYRLPVVKKKGSYGSIEEYIDTYYQLLREDCFASLRKGLSDLKEDKLDPRDMKVWINGSILGVHFNRTRLPGITFAIKAERRGGRPDYVPTQGTLLCISDNGGNFDSPIWGVVARCENDKKSMVIFAEIVDGRIDGVDLSVHSISRLLGASGIVLAENPTFYKAYEPVLKGLQQMDLQNFPFKEEFVYTKWTNNPPQYLTPLTTVNWGCLFGESSVRSGVTDLDNLIKCGYSTTLDESQLNAVKLAVNNRLVLIQGPPGTGKSFVGVRILEILLSADTLPSGPALVVTYKNQGLDHFLLSCLKFCPDGVVRVGGRSTEPSLEKFNLFSLVNRVDEFSSDFSENTKKIEEAKEGSEKALKQLQESYSFSIESVLRHMPDLQLKQLLSAKNYNRAILDLLPEEVSIADFIANDPPESKLLYQAVSRTIKEWMPRNETFKLIEDCFCARKTPKTLKQFTGDNNTSALDLEDDASNDFDKDKESNVLLEQFMETLPEDMDIHGDSLPGRTFNRPKTGGKNNIEWLADNFLSFTQGKIDKPFNHLRRSNDMDVERYHWLLNENPWDLNESHRTILVQVILQISHETAITTFANVKKAYDDLCQDMEEINKRRQLAVLKKAKIVGMTTTGAAMNREILQALSPAIIFFEEAAEVLEPQLLAVLGPSVQHLILIGDHYQLSPSVEVYELERRHDFAVSLFERLVEHNRMPFQALKAQSRMREEFVPMILPIYPNIRTNLKFVSGERNKSPACMTSPMYFWSHSCEETKQRSVANDGEAKMVIALLRWMIAEGQNPEEITVLAAYNGQVTLLREMLTKNPGIEGVQVLTIDRFQGSENKIIILSLVRSNEKGSIGHLAKRNRLCVAVSRARGAMYFCGNDQTLAKNSEHWRTLLDYLNEKNCVGNTLYLSCPRHSQNPPFLICSEHVASFTPNLCKRTCTAKLECGHYCQSTCHFGAHPQCNEEVHFRFSGCGHEATKKCSQDEEKLLCEQKLLHRFSTCGHLDFIMCWEKSKKELHCKEPCRSLLECGHPCRLQCYQNCKTKPCGACLEIEKARKEKERLLQARQLQLKLKEIEEEIQRLRSAHDNGPLITDLCSDGEAAAEYFQVHDRTEKFIQPGHDVVLIVTKIQKVINPQLQVKFLEAQRDLFSPDVPAQHLFHGTDDNGIRGITIGGFRLPGKDKNNMFGQGCYFATDSTKSAQNMYTKGSNKLLLCEVLLGKTWTVQDNHPDMDLEKIKKKGYDSLFSKRGGRGTGGTLYDEYVIYNPNQAIPRYIVHYRNQEDPQFLHPDRFQSNLTRITYEPSPTYNGNNAAEFHFRQAESQFYRMSRTRNHKVVQVELILNQTLQKRYDMAKQGYESNNKVVKQMFVFHGTDKNAIEKIISEGFKIGGQGVAVRNGSVYGTGVYTALDPDTSVGYTRGSGMMLLSLALVGQEGTDYNKGGSADVLVLKKADNLLPRYIVHFA